MSGKEIKNYVLSQNDTEYTVIVLNKDGKRVSYNAIKDDVMYNFKKINEIQIGAGMFVAQYLIENKYEVMITNTSYNKDIDICIGNLNTLIVNMLTNNKNVVSKM